jgi:cytidylate kinase
VARLVAQHLGFTLVDTGAIYRSVALAARRAGIPWEDRAAVTAVAQRLAAGGLRMRPGADGSVLVELDGDDVSLAIREPEISQGASKVSSEPGVRAALLALQRRAAAEGGVVLEGRDIGTVVIPDAEAKFFVTAAPEVRARRRHDELTARGVPSSFDRTLADVIARDAADEGREVAPLKAAPDARLVDTSTLAIDQVVAFITDQVRRLGALAHRSELARYIGLCCFKISRPNPACVRSSSGRIATTLPIVFSVTPRNTMPQGRLPRSLPGRIAPRAGLLLPRRLLFPCMLLLSGCTGVKKDIAGVTPLPRLAERPEDLLPPGLDLLLRLDVGRLRGVASSPALGPLRAPLQRRLDRDAASLRALLEARASVLWVGLRGALSTPDLVLVARGDFASFDPSSEGSWTRVPSRHPGQSVYERPGLARGVPSLLALLDNRVLALATPLEAPALRKALEGGPAGARKEVPAEGLVGFAVKPAALVNALREPYPRLASLLTEVASLEGVGDLEEAGAGGLRLELRWAARSEAGAARLDRVFRGWKEVLASDDEPLARAIASAAQVRREGPQSVRILLTLGAQAAERAVEALLR